MQATADRKVKRMWGREEKHTYLNNSYGLNMFTMISKSRQGGDSKWGFQVLLSFCPTFLRWRAVMLMTSVRGHLLSESRSKPGLSALEKSSLRMTFVQVWRASTAASKLGMGYAPGSYWDHRRKQRKELLYLKFCFWAWWNKYTFVSWC